MAGRNVEVLKREIRQLKSDFAEKTSGFKNIFSAIHEKIDEKFPIMEEMIKKLLESQTKPTTSEVISSLTGQENRRNSNIGIMRENHEVIFWGRGDAIFGITSKEWKWSKIFSRTTDFRRKRRWREDRSTIHGLATLTGMSRSVPASSLVASFAGTQACYLLERRILIY
ncbi:hypothetical protein KFK09_003212 [Dendrobium nobile]|uniref:Uncharacterized protein n=1 Tax=Dendrobium nobile TaxID=94219 RepID=A0A8T3C3H9_DENNO|nr:hypothetical protein KFK09_003212 [Dendrobium nobile]